MATRVAKLGQCSKTMEKFMKIILTSVNTMMEIDRGFIIPHNGTFSENGRKPPFSVLFVATRGLQFGLHGPKANQL